MTLQDYFEKTDDTPAKLGERSGIHFKTLEKLRRTGSIPNGSVMKRIYLGTGGRVTPFDFWAIQPLTPILPNSSNPTAA